MKIIRMGILVLSVCQATQASPYFVDSSGKPLALERTICGENGMVKMIDQTESLKKMGMPIGIYKSETAGGAALCSGTLVDKDLFLTARHCAGACSGISVTFGYLARNERETFRCKDIVEKGKEVMDQDYLLVRLEGSPGVRWGWYPLSDQTLTPGQELLMIHHPRGAPMKVSQKDCVFKSENSGLLEHRCDTESGSSGSSILLPNYDKPENTRVVGVHAFGGCNSSTTSSNSGPAIRSLAKISPLVKALIR